MVSAVNGKIAFESQRDGNREVYVMNPDGTGEINLTNNPAIDTDPAWSPDAAKIAFSSDRSFDLEIFVMNADGTQPMNLTQSPNTDAGPAWSPDGSKIAFHTFRDAGSGLQSEIYVMNADGTEQRSLTQNPAIDVFPRWSPDGSKISFVRIVPFGPTAEIYVMDAATGAMQTNLTNNPAADGFHAWSPDGSKIAFDSDRDALFGEVYVMDADGSNPMRLTNSPAGSGDPTWSPDGAKIAFARGVLDPGDVQIFAMNADGSDPVQLTDSGRNALPDWGVAAGTSPSCAEGVSEARDRIAQLLPDRPILRALLNFVLTNMQGGAPNAERNFGLLLDLLAPQLISAQDAADLKGLVAPC